MIMNTPAPPLAGLLRGDPASVRGAQDDPRILITWLHTNEELAPRAMHYVLAKRPDLARHVDFVCGNPRTARTDPAKGFTQTDLNRSFCLPHPPQSYEERQAAVILRQCRRYTCVLDLHTTVCDLGNMVITSEDMAASPLLHTLIAAAPNTRIVVMPAAVARHSLVGNVPHTLLLEYSQTIANTQGVADVLQTLEVLTGQRRPAPRLREFFYVDGTVPKRDDPGLDARNFELCQDGYYPIILGTGPRSYREDPTKDYCCFRATRKETVVL